MEITEVRIKLMEDSDDRLQGFCSITFDDCFVIRDLKIIEGANGPFVAMPSRKLTSHCPNCRCKNHLRAGYCNQCGARLKEDRSTRDADGRAKLYADIAHPVNSDCREMIQQRVIAEFQSEVERSRQPGYVSRYDDSYGDLDDDIEAAPAAQSAPLDRGGDHSRVQPPEKTPRPHHMPAAQREGSPGPHKRPKTSRPQQSRGNDDFGAGIF